MHQLRLGICGIIVVLSLLVGPASAQPAQEGLVNVNISDVTVQVPIAIAANICDVDINVLVTDLQDGEAACRAGAIALADDDDGGGPPPRQKGLINVNITDVDAQLPISVAANVCGVTVNVLVSELEDDVVDCTAYGRGATVSR